MRLTNALLFDSKNNWCPNKYLLATSFVRPKVTPLNRWISREFACDLIDEPYKNKLVIAARCTTTRRRIILMPAPKSEHVLVHPSRVPQNNASSIGVPRMDCAKWVDLALAASAFLFILSNVVPRAHESDWSVMWERSNTDDFIIYLSARVSRVAFPCSQARLTRVDTTDSVCEHPPARTTIVCYSTYSAWVGEPLLQRIHWVEKCITNLLYTDEQWPRQAWASAFFTTAIDRPVHVKQCIKVAAHCGPTTEWGFTARSMYLWCSLNMQRRLGGTNANESHPARVERDLRASATINNGFVFVFLVCQYLCRRFPHEWKPPPTNNARKGLFGEVSTFKMRLHIVETTLVGFFI